MVSSIALLSTLIGHNTVFMELLLLCKTAVSELPNWPSCCIVFSWADYLIKVASTQIFSSSDLNVTLMTVMSSVNFCRGGAIHICCHILAYLSGHPLPPHLYVVLYYSSGKSVSLVWYLIFKNAYVYACVLIWLDCLRFWVALC